MLSGLIGILLTLLLTGCSFLDSGSGSLTPIPTTVASATSTNTAVPTDTSTSPDTPTPGKTPSTPVPFAIKGVSLSTLPGNHTGTCPSNVPFTITAQISVPAHSTGGTVTYTWVRSDHIAVAQSSVTFAPNVTSQQVTYTWTLPASGGTGTTFSISMKTLSPQVVTSPTATFTYTCARQVRSISACVTLNSPCSTQLTKCGSGSKIFIFTAAITLTPGPGSQNIIYVWKRSDGTKGTRTTVTVPANQSSVTVTDSWSLNDPIPAGTYWEIVSVSAPNNVTSNQPTFTIITC